MSSAAHNHQSEEYATPETQTTTRTQPTTQSTTSGTAATGTQQPDASSTGAGSQVPPAAGGEDLPEQLHAGKVGYGPNYHRGPTLEEKMEGIKEEIKGKLTRNPDRVQHGREIKSGEDKQKKLTGEDQPNPFSNADEDKSLEKPGDSNAKTSDSTAKADEKLQLGKSGTTSSTTTGTGNFPSMKSTHNGHIRPDHGNGPDPRTQAAVVAPEGTHAAHRQKTEGGEGMMKHFGYDAPGDNTSNTGATKVVEPGQERERRSNPMMKN